MPIRREINRLIRLGLVPAEPDWTAVAFEPAERLIRVTKAKIKYGGQKAFYNPSSDLIQMPGRKDFLSPLVFYDTSFHELVHWTRPRLGRRGADEEIVADIGAMYIMAAIKLPVFHPGSLDWNRRSATKASRAANYILDFL